MKKLIHFTYLFIFPSTYFINAQEVIKTDTLSGTELKISTSKEISNIMEGLEGKCKKKNTNTDWNNNDEERKISVPKKALTDAEICRQNPRVMGYKIQLAVVKSNQEANEVKAYFRRRFPYIKTETDASLRPNYKILAGSYFSKASAAGDLKKIKEHFKSATAVQYYIFCEEGK